jgi:hypothetical protein
MNIYKALSKALLHEGYTRIRNERIGRTLPRMLFSVSMTYTSISVFPDATRGLEPINYRGVLVSTRLHATVYVYTKFAK